MIIFHVVSMTEGSPLDTNFARHTTISLDTFCFWLLFYNFTHFSSSSLITVEHTQDDRAHAFKAPTNQLGRKQSVVLLQIIGENDQSESRDMIIYFLILAGVYTIYPCYTLDTTNFRVHNHNLNEKYPSQSSLLFHQREQRYFVELWRMVVKPGKQRKIQIFHYFPLLIFEM